MEVARAGIAFYEHQRGIEVTVLLHRLLRLATHSMSLKLASYQALINCTGETHEEPDLEGGDEVGGLSSVSRGGDSH